MSKSQCLSNFNTQTPRMIMQKVRIRTDATIHWACSFGLYSVLTSSFCHYRFFLKTCASNYFLSCLSPREDYIQLFINLKIQVTSHSYPLQTIVTYPKSYSFLNSLSSFLFCISMSSDGIHPQQLSSPNPYFPHSICKVSEFCILNLSWLHLSQSSSLPMNVVHESTNFLLNYNNCFIIV